MLLLPIKNLIADEEYASLSYTIFNVLKINLQKQESLTILTDEDEKLQSAEADEQSLLRQKIGELYHAETFLTGEYFITGDTLHVIITVIEVASGRTKNSFINTMPADQGRYDALEEMSRKISLTIARDLPALDRDALIEKQVAKSQIEKIDNEEKQLEEVFKKNHEIRVTPLLGLHLGRSNISWAGDWHPLALPLQLEYSFFGNGIYHFRGGIEYLPFNLLVKGVNVWGGGVDILFGIHSQSLRSVSLDGGFAITYELNDERVVSGEKDLIEKRISFSLPIAAGLTLYVTPSFFINFRLTSYFLTYTLKSHIFTEEDKYFAGFAPFSILSSSLSVSIGRRF